MSSFERAFCCGAVWRSSSAAIARELRAQRLGRDILEIGAGSGSVAQQLLSRNPGLVWTAIDIDLHMTQADATALPFPDDSFDCVVSCLMLHHIIDWEKDECARNGLTISLKSRLLGNVMRFVAGKDVGEIQRMEKLS
jgi:SAM-dependent methyltransferase